MAAFGGLAAASGAESLEEVRERPMRPAESPVAAATHRDGLEGRVLCGYQGWFAAEGDGGRVGWRHWCDGRNGRVTVDLLPDVSELPPDERFTLRVGRDGPAVEVFSSARMAAVRMHFRWMREYGIDGVFVQRFAVALRDPGLLAHHTSVLGHCRDAALAEGRVYAVMYDLSGLPAGRTGDVLDDWRQLRSRMGISADAASLQLAGRPLVAVWGIGFGDGRAYSLTECAALVKALADEGCAVLVGVPTGWRTGDRDAVADQRLIEVAATAQVVSPWTVGRYRTPDEATRHADRDWSADLDWCRDRGIEYLPVIYPGFSWHNLKGGPLDQIPRQRGEFFERQAVEAARIGARCLYVAMFDECDEATAIFKSAEPPPGLADRFIGLGGVPADHYLRLAGAAGLRLRSRAPQPE
ncbi:MAG: glycoside hydrolase family 71/99-like protein [Planctomycetaceae bacterium]